MAGKAKRKPREPHKERRRWNLRDLPPIELDVVFSWQFLEPLGFETGTRRGTVTALKNASFFKSREDYEKYQKMLGRYHSADGGEGKKDAPRKALERFVKENRLKTLDELLKADVIFGMRGNFYAPLEDGYRNHALTILEFLGFPTSAMRKKSGLGPRDAHGAKVEDALALVLRTK